jgi:hypothetical protein
LRFELDERRLEGAGLVEKPRRVEVGSALPKTGVVRSSRAAGAREFGGCAVGGVGRRVFLLCRKDDRDLPEGPMGACGGDAWKS